MDDQLLNELRSLGEEPEPIDPTITGLIPQQEEEPQIGVSNTAREVSPLIDRLTEQRRREREREQQEAELKSRDSAFEALTDPQQYAEGVKGIVPGMVRSGGLALQAPDVFAARAQHNAAAFGRRQLEIMDRIDRGDDVSETEDAMGYRHMSPAQRLQAREQLTKAQRAFSPTPIQERPLFRAGESVKEFAEGISPAAPGYEESVGRMLGEGLGSMALGLPASFIGPMPAAVLFGAMGVGEATDRAVEWDKKERAAGRPGLTQDQIALAGILGTAPGVTDVLPVEVLVGRLPIPMPRWMRSAVARGIGRIGGQAFIEGVQEGGQAFLQNLISREVYDPNQPLVEGIEQEAAIGGGVGAIAQTAQELAGWVLRSVTGRRARTPDERREQPAPETETVVDLDQFADALEPEGERPVDERPLEPLAPDVRGQLGEGEELAASIVQDRLSDEAREYLNEAYTTVGRDPDTNLSTVPASELRQMAEYLRGVQQDIRTESGRFTPGRDELNPPDPAITELLRGINAELRRDAAAQRRQPQLPLEEPSAEAAVADQPETVAAPQDVSSDGFAAPTFDDIASVLPKDANGDPDFARLNTRMQAEFGKTGWNNLTPDEKVQLYRTFGGEPEPAPVEAPESATEADGVPEAVSPTEEAEAAPAPTAAPEEAITEDTRRSFREILAGKAPRRQWAQQLGVSGDQLQALIDEAVQEGLLRVDRNGVVRRTARAKQFVPPTEPEAPQPGSPEDLAQREAAARAVMESDEWKAATAAPAFDTSKVPGYLSEEWKASRRYVRPDGSVIGDYYDALNYLMDQAYAAVPGGVANERKLYIVMGYPGAGKSTIINSLRAQKRAAHIVADDAKVIIPEYDGGRNTGGVHEESSDIASTLTAMALSTGDNLIIEKLGSSENSITKWIRAAKSEGYTVTLINVDVPKAIAMERAVARYRRTGRAVPLSVYDDLRSTDLYNIINSQGVTDDQATIQWQEPQGWRITEAGPELANLPLESRTRPALAEGDQPRVRRQPRLGADREEGRLGGREGRRPEGPGAPEGPVASLSIPPEIRLARAIETREAITGKPVNSIVLDYAARIEEARGTDAFDGIMSEIRADRLFLKADAHDLAALVGYPVPKSATKKAALETVERRHREAIEARREVVRLEAISRARERLPVPRPAESAVASRAVREFANAVNALKQELGVETRPISPDAVPPRGRRAPDISLPSLKAVVEQIQRGSRLQVVVDHVTGFTAEANRIIEVVRQNESVDIGTATEADLRQFFASLNDLAQIIQDRLQKGYVLADEVQEIGSMISLRLDEISTELFRISDDASTLADDLSSRSDEIDERLEELRGPEEEVEEDTTGLTPLDEPRPTLLQQAQQPIPEEATALDVVEQERLTSVAVLSTLSDRARELLSRDITQMDADALDRLREQIDDVHRELMFVRDWTERMSEVAYDKSVEAIDFVSDLQDQRLNPALDNLEEAQDELSDRIEEVEERLSGSLEEPPSGGFSLAALTGLPRLPEDPSAPVDALILTAIERQIDAMLPADVATRIKDRITHPSGAAINAQFLMGRRLVELGVVGSPLEIFQRGKHEVVHALRMSGLFSQEEWQRLVSHAKKINIDEQITVDDGAGNQVPGMPAYRQIYGDMLRSAGLRGKDLTDTLNELLDQERVAKMAEQWVAREARFGRAIDSLFDRVLRFFEAIARALNSLGIRSLDDFVALANERDVQRIAERVLSGEVGARAVSEVAGLPEGLQQIVSRLPRSDVGQVVPSVASQEGRAALEALRGGRAAPVSDLPPSTPPGIAEVIQSIRASGQGVGIPLKRTGFLVLPEGDVSALAIRAFHGSPHDFEPEPGFPAGRFRMDRIGTGEGAQAYGRGLYFAEAEDVARSYRDALAMKAAVDPNAPLTDPKRIAAELYESWQGDVKGALEDARYYDNAAEVIAELRRLEANPPKGRMYEVRINANPDEFLDWDKPLSQQPQRIQEVLRENATEDFLQVAEAVGPGRASQLASMKGGRGRMEDVLRKAGIPGIKYLDQGSRDAGEGTRNYVVFDDSLIEIVAKDGKPVSREDFAAASIRSVPEEPTRPFNIEGFTGSVTSSVDENGNRVRTYRVSEEDIGSFERRGPADAGSVIEPSTVGFAVLKEQDDGSWSVSMVRIEPDHRRQGVPSRLFRAIEEDLGQRLAPQGWLTAEQYAEIAEANPEAVRYHQPAGPAFDDMWVSPKQMEFGAEILKEFAGETQDARAAREALDQARQLEAMRALVPPEAFEQEQAMLAIRGLPHPMQLGDPRQSGLEPPERSLSDLVSAVTDALGLTVRHGRLSPGLKARAGRLGMAVAGQFSRATGVTRIAIPNDLATLAHEGGHALETRNSTRDDVRQLQDDHVEELLTPPSRDYPPPKMPASGYSGIELDADTQQVLLDAVQADVNLRALATQAGQAKSGIRLMRGKFDEAAYKQAQRDAGMLRAVLIRRLGRRVADAAIDDVKNAAPNNLQQYIAQRFSRTGTPAPRPPLPQASREALSEGWAEFFRLYVTNPQQARIQAPRLYEAFEDMLDGAEPEMLEQLQEIQRGFTELKQSSPAGAVMSRVQSSVKPGMFAQFRKDLAEKGPRATISDKLYTFYHAAVDGRHPMKRAVKFLMELAADNLGVQLGPNERMVLKAADDPYKLWRLAEHSKVWATATLQNGVRLKGEAEPQGPSFHEALSVAFGGTAKGQWNDQKAQLFGSYLVARRMLAEWKRYERGELENPPDSLIEKRVWQKARQDIEKAHPEFARAAQLLYQFNKRHLQNKYLNGFITKELYLELNAREDYVPLNRMMDDNGPSALTKPRGQNKRKLIYRFKGSTRDFINPLESIAQDVYATQARFALNDVISAMDRLSRAVGPGGGVIAERIPPTDIRGTRVDIREAMKQAAKDLDPNDAQGLMDMIDDLFDQEASATIFRAVPTEEKGEPIVYLWEEGKRIPIRLGDNRIARDIFETMVALGRNNAEPVIDALAMGTQAFRFGVTKAPSYIMVNFLRDQLATWVLSRDYVPFWSGAKGLKNVLANDAALKRYQSFAGISGIESGLIEQMAGERDVMTLRRKGALASTSKLGTFMRAMEITELASRVGHFEAAYQRALRDGFTPEEAATEAAYAAHDVYDWTRRGAKMSQVARIIAFGNAALQGLDAARRTITGERDIHKNYRQLLTPYIKAANGSPLSVAEKEALPNSVRVWVKLVGIGMIGVALAALYRDDEEYEEFNDYMKATHWFFKVGGVWWRVPKPFELAVVSNIFESAFDAWWRQDDRAHIRFLEAMRETFLPPAEVQGLAALEQIGKIPSALWERFVAKPPFSKPSDSDIPQHLKALPPELQFTAYTSELGKMLGAVLNWSPAQIDNFITNTFATIGRDVLALSDQTLPRVNQLLGGRIPGVSKSPRAEKPIEDFWVVSRFTRRASRGALSTQYFWQQMSMDGGKYVQAANGYRELLRAGNEVGAKELLDGLDPERRAYALLEGHFKENDQDIHPMNRARQVIGAMSGIRREMVLDRLVKQSTANKRHIEPEKIVLSPSKQKIVNEILEDLAMREARNALIVVQHPGWKNKEILPTDGLLAELRAAVPEVAEELDYRLNKGRYKVYPFEGVRKAWPKAKEALLKEGQDAILAEFRTEARFP